MAKKVPERADREAAARYTKTQILQSRVFEQQRDIITAVLTASQRYTLAEIEAAIQAYYTGALPGESEGR